MVMEEMYCDFDDDESVDIDHVSTTGPARLAVIPDHDVRSDIRDLTASNPGPTLLPTSIAKVVSFATRSASLALRMSTVVGGYGFDAAKLTTLSSLELGRGILEGILSRAGRDVVGRSSSELGRADAETILEKSLENLHRTMTQLVFWTTTGFHLTGTTLAMVSETSQLLLSTLDQFFGSTDSSRAMASIITLIRREFQNPATGVQGEKVGVVDLMMGLCGMAYLQQMCRHLLEEESRSLRLEETVWDVVVLSDGVRVDVHEQSLCGVHEGSYSSTRSPILHDSSNSSIVDAIETHGAHDSDYDDGDDDGVPEMMLKRQIMRSMSDNAHVSITTQIHTTKTITVDITGGTKEGPFAPPPGVELIEQSGENLPSSSSSAVHPSMAPSYRFVYRVNRNKERRTSLQKEDGDISQVAGFVEPVDTDSHDGSATEVEEFPPPVPPKSTESTPPMLARRRISSSSAAPTSPSLSPKPSRIPALPRHGAENTANQKRPRNPPTAITASGIGPSNVSRRESLNRLLTSRKRGDKDVGGSDKPADKQSGFRGALKRPVSIFNREDSGSETATGRRRGKQAHQEEEPPSPKLRKPSPATPQPHLSVASRPSPSLIPKREAPRPPSRHMLSGHRASNSGSKASEEPYTRTSSRASFFSVHESRCDSTISHTESYSITTGEDFIDAPMTPAITTSRSDKDLGSADGSPGKSHRRVKSQLYTPSIYTLRANDSHSSLVPYHGYYRRSAFSDNEALVTLRRAGIVDGMFPRYHLLRNITRYMRFASASYGSNFLKVMGIAKEMPILRALDDTHHELRSFAHHTESDTNSILLSSFVDPQGGSDGTGSTNTGVPLVHYISLDHESKAVVLACRGTLGFEDVLADMTCDYDDLVWRGKSYKVHKGVHASAKRLLYGGDGRVLYTLKQALEEFSDYGLVLTGHSLGGAVTALLGVMLSEPAPDSSSFVTSSEPHAKLLGDGYSPTAPPGHICLPPGRPVHVYAYGPPSTMSASLSTATRGLITSIVNGNDLVPYLSLGVLHDFQAVALAFKTDNNEAKVEVRQRIWVALQSGIADKWYGASGGEGEHSSASSAHRARREESEWAYAALKILRASMMSTKLLPPGEVFIVESTRVLRRDAFVRDEGGGGGGGEHFGRPAQRIVLKYLRDVENRFREVRFGTSMLTDHSPGKYEDALNKLSAGVMGTGK